MSLIIPIPYKQAVEIAEGKLNPAWALQTMGQMWFPRTVGFLEHWTPGRHGLESLAIQFHALSPCVQHWLCYTHEKLVEDYFEGRQDAMIQPDENGVWWLVPNEGEKETLFRLGRKLVKRRTKNLLPRAIRQA